MSLYALLNQDKVWVDVKGNFHQVEEMSVRYKGNVVRFVERRAATYGLGYALGQVESIFAPIGREVLGVNNGKDVHGDVVYGGPRGEMACDALADALAEDDARREADPVGFIRDTKLMRRLISDIEQGLGGVDD